MARVAASLPSSSDAVRAASRASQTTCVRLLRQAGDWKGISWFWSAETIRCRMHSAVLWTLESGWVTVMSSKMLLQRNALSSSGITVPDLLV